MTEQTSEFGIQSRPFLGDLFYGVEETQPKPGNQHLFAAATGSAHLHLVEEPPVETERVRRRAEPLLGITDRPSPDETNWRIVDVIVKQLSLQSEKERTRADFDVATASPAPETPFEEETLSEIRRLVDRDVEYRAINSGPDFEWNNELKERHVQAVFDSAFRYGRFQQYLREEGVEDVSVVGYDNVMVTLSNGRREKRAPIAESNDDLEQRIADLASWRGRVFSRPNGHVDLDLGGARFSATGTSITTVPNATFRRHNLVDITLDDMVEFGTINQKMALLLEAASKANSSGLIAGYPAAGKTTFLRAMMSCVPWEAKIVTIETERELYLNKLPNRHSQVQDFQYVPSTLSGSDLTASYSLEDAFRESLRSSAERILFGEIRGPEGPIAIKAMQAGKGSLSTIHARNANDALHRFADVLMTEQRLSDNLVPLRQILRTIDLVVYIDIIPNPDGTRRRIVTEIAEVIARPNEQLPMASPLFQWDYDRGIYRQPEKPSPDLMRMLTRHGLSEEMFWESD